MEERSLPTHSRFRNLTGKTFGKLKVISFAGMINNRRGTRTATWNCVCECGKECQIIAGNLITGCSKSCGCVQRENSRNASIVHGYCVDRKMPPEYFVWSGMWDRCTRENNKSFPDYGGRGITVCDRWKDFPAWFSDMGPRPTRNHTIERRDTNGNYEPINCIWDTRKAQNRNKRNNTLLTFNGITKCIVEWAEELGVDPKNLSNRKGLGWTDERILTEIVKHQPKVRYIEFDGRIQSIKEWAKEIGIADATIHKRLEMGWAIERTLTTPIGPNGGKCRKKATIEPIQQTPVKSVQRSLFD